MLFIINNLESRNAKNCIFKQQNIDERLFNTQITGKAFSLLTFKNKYSIVPV